MKKGVEVEGKHLGLVTIFCSYEEFTEWKKLQSEILNHLDVKQVYISDHENRLNLLEDKMLLELASVVKVTVERTYVPQYINDKIDVMLAIVSSSFWNLRAQDQVKFSVDLNVFSICKGDMVYTAPSAFDGDIEL